MLVLGIVTNVTSVLRILNYPVGGVCLIHIGGVPHLEIGGVLLVGGHDAVVKVGRPAPSQHQVREAECHLRRLQFELRVKIKLFVIYLKIAIARIS